ncbi:MAG: OmpA family protein [Pirellulaceae bacterium]|nr:OmpA family protein [Pirellulaceae bacterium]
MSTALSLALGCAGPNAQVSQIQSEKQELISTVKAQKEEKEALQQRAASLESRLDQSEKEIVRLTGRKSNWDESARSASSKNLPLPLGEGRGEGLTVPNNDEKTSPIEKLPWRAPAASPSTSKPSTTSPQEPAKSNSTRISSKVTPSLRSLAQRDSRLQYDAATDTARYQLDIAFEDNAAGLTAEGRKRLDDLASWLKAEQTKELRVLVSGSSTGMKKPKAGDDKPRFANDRQLGAARAGAVADYLDRHGITADRLVIVGSGGPQKSLEDTSGSPVQIHLAESSAPVLGLVPKQPALRR